MSSFVFALGESLTPPAGSSLSSPVMSKSMANICPDDVHNIQVHAAELQVLERAQQRLEMIQERASRLSPGEKLVLQTLTVLQKYIFDC